MLLFPFIAQAANYPPIQTVPLAQGEAWLVRDESLPIFTVRLSFEKAGTAYDVKGKEGRAYLLAHLLTEGAGDYDGQAFKEALERHAIKLSVSPGRDHFSVEMTSLTEHSGKAFELLGLALTQPQLGSDAIARAKRKALSALKQSEQRPGSVLMQEMKRIAYGAHGYANQRYGSEASLETIGAEDVRAFLTASLTRDNLIIAVSGDVTSAQLTQWIDAHLALPKAYQPDVTLAPVSLGKLGETVDIKREIPQTLTAFITPGITRKDERFYAAYMFNQIMGGGTLTSIFGDAIREQRGLAYSVYTTLDPSEVSPSFGGMFATRTDKADEALEVMKDTAREVAKDGIDAQLLADAKAHIKGSFVLSLDTNSEITAYLIAIQRHQLGIDYFARRDALMDAVTAEQIQAIASEFLRPEQWLTVRIGQ